MTPKNVPAMTAEEAATRDRIAAAETPSNQRAIEVATQTQPPALVDSEHDEWADVSSGDLSPDDGGLIPALTMNRKLDGGFVMEDTGEISDTVSFVWLAKMRSRAYWPEAFGKGDAAPTCRSNDGVAPDPASPDVQSTACAVCPNSTWDGSEAPACRESVEALVFMPDDLGAGRMARLRFNGIAIAPAKAYWSSFDRRMPRRPPLSVVTECHLEPTETKNGKFLVPRFKVQSELTRTQVAPLIAERDRRIADWQAHVARDVATGTGHTEEQAPSTAGTVVLVDGSAF